MILLFFMILLNVHFLLEVIYENLNFGKVFKIFHLNLNLEVNFPLVTILNCCIFFKIPSGFSENQEAGESVPKLWEKIGKILTLFFLDFVP